MVRTTRGYWLLELPLAYLRHAQARALLLKISSKGGCIVDLACGKVPLFLEGLTGFNRKIGIDQTTPECRVPDIQTVGADLATGRIPLPDDSVSVVTALAFLEHVSRETAQRMCQDVLRILHTGGAFIVTTPHRRTRKLLWLLSRLMLVSREEIDEHHALFSPQTLRQLLCDAGFMNENIATGTFQMGCNIWCIART